MTINLHESFAPGPRNLEALLTEVDDTIQRIRYERLRGQLLLGVNPELNTDREELVSRMEGLGFRRDIADALQQLEPKLLAAGTPLDFKGCMDIIRTIFEEIVEDAGKKAAAFTGTAIPSGKLKDFQPWKDLLATTRVLTPDEADLFQKLYNYISNVGAHKLGSSQEHARVAKNTVIEWSLLVVGRVQALSSK